MIRRLRDPVLKNTEQHRHVKKLKYYYEYNYVRQAFVRSKFMLAVHFVPGSNKFRDASQKLKELGVRAMVVKPRLVQDAVEGTPYKQLHEAIRQQGTLLFYADPKHAAHGDFGKVSEWQRMSDAFKLIEAVQGSHVLCGVLNGKTFSATEMRSAMTGNSPRDNLASVVRSLPHMRIPMLLNAHATQALRGLQWFVDQHSDSKADADADAAPAESSPSDSKSSDS